MAGTNSIDAKAAILAILKAAPALAGVQVEYVWPGRTIEREVIYGGKIQISNDYFTFASPQVGGGRQPRLETATITWHIEVRHVDSDPQAADERVVELGTVLEETIAADPTLGGLAGTLAAAISSGDLEYVRDDDGLTSVMAYDITVRSELV
jgi:hypothetical protein